MIAEQHFGLLKGRYDQATMTPNGDGSFTVTVPNLAIGKGWSRETVTVAFVVPAGYPLASPDCFWSEPGLALDHGGIPQNTGQNPGPGIPPGWLWFSWHPSNWSANDANLGTYLNVIKRRFAEPK